MTGGLLSVDVRTLARVMTKVNHTLYTRVKPRECFGLAWSKDGTLPRVVCVCLV